MKLSKDAALKIARLARLNPDDAKIERFSNQVSDILDYMDALAKLDTTGVEPLYSPSEHATVFRPDEPRKIRTREEILQNAPEADGRFFIVPKIV